MTISGKLLSSYLLAIFLEFLVILEAANASGLSFKLIHRFSLDSPFYHGNITTDERIRLQIRSASSYASRLASGISSRTQTKDSDNNIITNAIRPRMDNQDAMYLIQVGIGTFRPPRPQCIKYFLHLDTASDLMWTQCEECRKMGRDSCFRQRAPLFPAKSSSTYRPLSCDKHSLCFPGDCINKTCSYFIEYADNAMSMGYLASDSLTFDSDKNQTETVKDVVFGCGIKNKGFEESSKNNLAAGNFALGFGEHSFLRQKQSLTLGRFSYCLPPWKAARNFTIYLRLGADIPQREGLKETPLVTRQGLPFYYVNLKGISVGNKSVDLPQKFFSRANNSQGGCIIDSGSSITLLPPLAYGRMKAMLMNNHFMKYRRIRNQEVLDLCYMFPRNTTQKDLPTITFHLQDADLVFPPKVGFTTFKIGFCLAMWGQDMDGMTVVGALQQVNSRFIFDTVKRKLYFGPEDCTRAA